MQFQNIYECLWYVYVTTDRVLKYGFFETKCYEMTKQLYFGLWASNKKNKITLFPVTFKVWENKVVLFLWFKAPTQSYGDFKVWLENMIIYRTLESVLPTKDPFFGGIP